MEPSQSPEETSFLLPMPRERHSENVPSVKRPPIQGPPKTIKLPPATPDRKQPPNKTPIPPKNDCRTQLKLVDKDVTTGRSYIKALDKRFRILKRNLEKALHDCQGRRLEEASYKKYRPEIGPAHEDQGSEAQGSEVRVSEVQGSELVLRSPEAAVYEFDDSNWESVLDSIQEILPKIVETNTARNNYEEQDLQPACSFRSYNRAQRYGRRYEGFDSDFDSDYDYYKRHRGYGQRHYDSYNDPYDDRYYGNYFDDSEMDYDYRRSPYGRRRGYDSYYGRKKYGRRRDPWLTSNKSRDTQSKGHKESPRIRIKQHKYDPYDKDSSEDFYYSSDEDYSKSSGFDSFSGPSDAISWSDEPRGGGKRGINDHYKRKEDRLDRRKADRYGGRDSNRHKYKQHKTPKKGFSNRPRRKYYVNYRRYYEDPCSRHIIYGGRNRYRGYYSDESSYDTDMDYYGRNGIRKYCGRDRYRGRYGYGNYGRYGRHRQYGSYYGGRHRNRRYDRRRGSRHGRRRYGRYYGSDSDYDSDISNYTYYGGDYGRSYGSPYIVDSGSSSFDGRYRRDWSERRHGGKRYHIPRYYVSTGCRQGCKPKAIEPVSPSKKKEQSSKPRTDNPPAEREAVTC